MLYRIREKYIFHENPLKEIVFGTIIIQEEWERDPVVLETTRFSKEVYNFLTKQAKHSLSSMGAMDI